MHRRDALRLTGSAFLFAAFPILPRWSSPAGASDTLFLDAARLEQVRRNARTPLLKDLYATWAAVTPAQTRDAMAKVVETGNLIYDLRDALRMYTRAGIVHIVEPTVERRDALLETTRILVDLPRWDYFLDGGTDLIGIMRASMATERLLFMRELLAEDIDAAFDEEILDAVAEKGCVPCFRTIYGMNNPETVRGWGFTPDHAWVYDLSMARWPEILGANNLRAIPTMGLGLGALALEGRDPRAPEWLSTAEDSAHRFMNLISPDGSYFEGISYIDYAFRTLLHFCEAHQRTKGTIAWRDTANMDGVVNYILALQAGRREDGNPDIVNFSDAFFSTVPALPAWIQKETGYEVAKWTADNVSHPASYLDFLWYDERLPSSPPPEALKNRRLDLDWVICRSGWEPDDAVLAFRSGGPANHEHADRNSFLFKIFGERLLTDHYGADYDSRKPGWLLRLTEAHNAVLIDGQGHQYHQGEEGTNEGLAWAHVIRFVDEGERVWWTSDATHGYHLVDDQIASVVRTMAFAKPNIIVMLDQVRMHDRPARLDVRFFPDNRDEKALLQHAGSTFRIARPGATLHGHTFSATPASLAERTLDLPRDLGIFPFVEVTSPAALHHEVVTILVAEPAGSEAAIRVTAERDANGWAFEAAGVRGMLHIDGETVEVRWL
jgi:hypothetical protein